MNRFPGLAGGAAATILPASAAHAVIPVDAVQKVVYHLSEPGRVGFVLGNIRNHIAGKGGPDKVRIVLVIHGPALAAFATSKSSPDMKLPGMTLNSTKISAMTAASVGTILPTRRARTRSIS